MTRSLVPLALVVRHAWPAIVLWGLSLAIGGQLLQLVLLIVRFGDLPNYGIHYDWIASIVTIAQSTPSLKDMLPIMFGEWWIEIGFMNYDYGNGISEWSLNVIPSRLFILFVLGNMLAILVFLRRNTSCSSINSKASLAGAGLGTLLVYATSVAMSWVVCCATPSWVVGLAMLGLSVSVSLALEDLGPTLFYSGTALLALSIIYTSRSQALDHQRNSDSALDDIIGKHPSQPYPGT